jgi:hypothetical protein
MGSRRLAITIALFAGSCIEAHAASRPLFNLPIPLPLSKQLSPDQVWKNIVAATAADLNYAKAMADASDAPGAKLRAACYAEIINLNAAANGTSLKVTKPEPALITTFEQAAEVADALQPTSKLVVACAPAANAVKADVMRFVNLAVTGAAGLAVFGIAIP